MKVRYYHKLLVVFLILTIVIPHGFFGVSHKVLAAQTGIVTATMLNVRTQPSATADRVQLNGTYVYLNKGETVTILGEESDFLYVSLKFNGKTVEGYVHKDFIQRTDNSTSPTPTPTPAPTATPKPTATPVPTVTPGSASPVVASITKQVEISATVTASTLNVRSGPGTGYSKVSGLVKGNGITVISEVMAADHTEWYGITYKARNNTITGYVASTYIKLSYSNTIKAKVSVEALKLRQKAASDSSYVTNKSGSTITLKLNKAVTILDEITVAGVKWQKITVTLSDVKYTGYVESTQVKLKATVASPTASPTPTPKPTVKPVPTKAPTATPKPTVKPTPTKAPTATPKPTVKPTPTKAPTVTPKPTAKPTVTPKPAVTPTITPVPVLTPSPVISDISLLEIQKLVTYDTIKQPMRGYVCNTLLLNVFGDIINSIYYLLDESGAPVVLQSGQEVIVSQAIRVDTVIFYKVDFWNNGVIKTGYVQSEFIYIKTDSSNSSSNQTPSATPTPTPASQGNLSFEQKLAAEGFPASYIPSLVQLHQQYPNWEFKAYQTGLDWNTVIAQESIPGKNLIPNSRGIEWKSLENGAYDWKTDTFNVFDGTIWVTASQTAISYYMDPRNFLTASGIFQFELLKYQKEYQNAAGVENILKGTALYNAYYNFIDENGVSQKYSYAETFVKAAEYSGVSPYHLASRVKQEVVTGSTTLSDSVSGTLKGYEGLYNFYNIGASNSAGGGAIAKGLTFAKNGTNNSVTNTLYMIPWVNPFKAIVGGAYFIGGSYINRGQDTIYLQKFNVTPISTYYHQYMSNLEAPYAEGKKILTAYNGLADSPIIFSIPVYLNMPSAASPAPTTMYNPNNRMKALKVLDVGSNELTVTPTFSQTELNYYLMVGNTVDTIRITATAVSKKATVGTGGDVALSIGTNEILIPIIAENGDVANYKLTVVRAEQ